MISRRREAPFICFMLLAVCGLVGSAAADVDEEWVPNYEYVQLEPLYIARPPEGVQKIIKGVPGFLKDVSSTRLATGVTRTISIGVTRTMAVVDAIVLAEDIGLELFDKQLENQKVELLILDERSSAWKKRIQEGPPLSNEEKRAMRAEFRTYLEHMQGGETRFVGRALTQPHAIRLAVVATVKHYGLRAVGGWLTKRVFRPGKRLKSFVFSSKRLKKAEKKFLQRAWKELSKRQVEADKIVDVIFKQAAALALVTGAVKGAERADEVERKERERIIRNELIEKRRSSRYNLALRIESMPRVVIAESLPRAVPMPRVVAIPRDPVIRAATVDYQLSPTRQIRRQQTHNTYSPPPSSYRQQRFYPKVRDHNIGLRGNAINQAIQLNVGGWSGL